MGLNCSNCELYNKCLMYALSLAYGKTLHTTTDRDVLVKKFVEEVQEAHHSFMCENFNILESEADRAYSLLLTLDIAGRDDKALIRMIYDSNKR